MNVRTFDENVLYFRLVQFVKSFEEEATKHYSSLGRYFAWDACFYIESALLAYERTNQDRFLNLLAPIIRYFIINNDRELSRTDTLRGRILCAWGTDRQYSNKPFPKGGYTVISTHVGRVSSVLLKFGFLVQSNTMNDTIKELAFKASHVARLSLIDIDDCFNQIGDKGFYVRLLDNEVEALNHLTILAEAHFWASKVFTEDNFFSDKLERLNSFFSECFYFSRTGCLCWNYKPCSDNPRNGQVEAIWKTQITLRYFWCLYRFDCEIKGLAFSSLAQSVFVNVFKSNNFNSAYDLSYRLTSSSPTFRTLDKNGKLKKSKDVFDLACLAYLQDGFNDIKFSVFKVIDEIGGDDVLLTRPRGLFVYAYYLNL